MLSRNISFLSFAQYNISFSCCQEVFKNFVEKIPVGIFNQDFQNAISYLNGMCYHVLDEQMRDGGNGYGTSSD
jgi:hypothetical protein